MIIYARIVLIHLYAHLNRTWHLFGSLKICYESYSSWHDNKLPRTTHTHHISHLRARARIRASIMPHRALFQITFYLLCGGLSQLDLPKKVNRGQNEIVSKARFNQALNRSWLVSTTKWMKQIIIKISEWTCNSIELCHPFGCCILKTKYSTTIAFSGCCCWSSDSYLYHIIAKKINHSRKSSVDSRNSRVHFKPISNWFDSFICCDLWTISSQFFSPWRIFIRLSLISESTKSRIWSGSEPSSVIAIAYQIRFFVCSKNVRNDDGTPTKWNSLLSLFHSWAIPWSTPREQKFHGETSKVSWFRFQMK